MDVLTKEHINTFLVQEDVEGFIAAGAPLDEYSDEAAQIALILQSHGAAQITEDAAYAALALVWLRNFELAEQEMQMRLPALRQIARKIIAVVKAK